MAASSNDNIKERLSIRMLLADKYVTLILAYYTPTTRILDAHIELDRSKLPSWWMSVCKVS